MMVMVRGEVGKTRTRLMGGTCTVWCFFLQRIIVNSERMDVLYLLWFGEGVVKLLQ